VQKIVIEIVIEIGMEQTRIFNVTGSTVPPFVPPFLLPYLTLPPSFHFFLLLTALGVLRMLPDFAAARRCLQFLVDHCHA